MKSGNTTKVLFPSVAHATAKLPVIKMVKFEDRLVTNILLLVMLIGGFIASRKLNKGVTLFLDGFEEERDDES